MYREMREMKKTKTNKARYEVVATFFDGRRAGHCEDTRLAICLYWAKEQRMAAGAGAFSFKFFCDSKPIAVKVGI